MQATFDAKKALAKAELRNEKLARLLGVQEIKNKTLQDSLKRFFVCAYLPCCTIHASFLCVMVDNSGVSHGCLTGWRKELPISMQKTECSDRLLRRPLLSSHHLLKTTTHMNCRYLKSQSIPLY